MTDLPADAITAAVPPEAITAALDVAPAEPDNRGGWEPAVTEADVRRMLEAAAPHITTAERERLKYEMPTVVIQVADGGVISEAEWNALGDRLKAAWHEHIDAAVAAERARWTRIEPDPGQPGYNRGVFDVSGFAAEVLAPAERERICAEAAAAERQRIARTSFSASEDERLGLFKLAAADGALAERQRIHQLAEHAAGLIANGNGPFDWPCDCDDCVKDGNEQWITDVRALLHQVAKLAPQPAGADSDQAENLREVAPPGEVPGDG